MIKKHAHLLAWVVIGIMAYSPSIVAQESLESLQSEDDGDDGSNDNSNPSEEKQPNEPVKTDKNSPQTPPETVPKEAVAEAPPVDPVKLAEQAKANSVARGEGSIPCREQCRTRSAAGSTVWIKFNSWDEAQNIMVQILSEDLNNCPNSCSKELTVEACVACAERNIPDDKLEKDKAKLAPFICTDQSQWNGRDCSISERVLSDPAVPAAVKAAYLQQKKAQEEQKRSQHEKEKPAIALKYADDEAKKAADLLPIINQTYIDLFNKLPSLTKDEIISGWQPSPETVKAFQKALELATEAFTHKQRETLFREYAEGKPFNPNRSWCFPACNNRMPFNEMKVTNYSGWLSKAKIVASYLSQKSVMECVTNCASRSDSECDACAKESIPDETQQALKNGINDQWGCDRKLDEPPPSAGQIAGIILLETFTGAITGGYCNLLQGSGGVQVPKDHNHLKNPKDIIK